MGDFGTRYSSLANLRRFQVDELKIDRTFIAGVVERADDATIVSLVIRPAEELRLNSIAEGV
jgi:EAL domain-containing protein (putative c-di-GMP-specific phosphodiesterase class I)